MQNIRTDNKNYRLQLFGSNILYVKHIFKTEITLEITKEISANAIDLTKGERFFAVIDFRDMYASMSNEAKKFIAKDKKLNDLRICDSILVNNLPVKLLVDGYLKMNRPISTTKAFSKIESCSMWMQTNGCAIEDLIIMKQALAKKNKEKPSSF